MSLTRVSLAAATLALALAWPAQPAHAFCGFYVAGATRSCSTTPPRWC